MSDVDHRVTPSLHPDNVNSLDGYDADTAPFLQPTLDVFDASYKAVQSIWDAKEGAARDPTMTDAGRLLRVDDFAATKVGKVTRAMDGVLAGLNKSITSIEADLSKPIEARGSLVVATEVRAHLKALDSNERMKVIREAIKGGDDRVATAALGAPAMLSGIDPKMQMILTREYHLHHNPVQAKRIKAMQSAKSMIERNGPLLLTEVEKAVGHITEPKSMRKIYASDLRKQKAFADKPFAS